MMVSVETYLRRGQRQLRHFVSVPGVQLAGKLAVWGGGGFLLTAAELGGRPQPLAMGAICGASGWRALVMGLGSLLGYRFFWGQSGIQGMIWAAGGCLLSLLLGNFRQQTLLLPAFAGVLAAVTGLSFRLLDRQDGNLWTFLLGVAVAAGSAHLFARAAARQESVTDWLAGGTVVFALAKVFPLPYLGLGSVAGGILAAGSAFPGAVLGGIGLDLARVTPVPMAAVFALAHFARMLPVGRKWIRFLSPAVSCLGVMAVLDVWDRTLLPGLLLGGFLGALLPAKPVLLHRRGEMGLAQVRLEMTAGVLLQVRQLLREQLPPPIDREALLEKVKLRACGTCSARNACREKEGLDQRFLQSPLEFQCRKTGRVLPELRRCQEQLRYLRADRDRRQEYAAAMEQQYLFLAEYLRRLADQLPRRGERREAKYRIEVASRSRGRDRESGDRCMAFSCGGYRFFVLLCDGMGTGPGAAREGNAAGEMLRQMLSSGFPPEHALRSLNSLLTLGGQAGAVTVDLAEVRLDSGSALLYKWGAAPSWRLSRTGTEKIGTATPPPGISVTEARETVLRLSLRGGEALILTSDGVEAGDVLRRKDLSPEAPPGELAERLLEENREKKSDDATVAVIRLVSLDPVPS